MITQWEGRTAVVTGGASGIGFSMASAFAARGMRVVVADVEQTALDGATAKIADAGGTALGVHTDVSQAGSVDALARGVAEEFGAVHLLCNNAGVTVLGNAWEHTADDWAWVVGVNLLGVANGVRAFVPAMIEHGDETHVVNTASTVGLATYAGNAIYSSTKHAVVALTETLWRDLRAAGSRVGVSLLCPGRVPTRLGEAARNRPTSLPDSFDDRTRRQAIESNDDLRGIPVEDVGGIVADAVASDTFYVFTDDSILPLVGERGERIHAGLPPVER